MPFLNKYIVTLKKLYFSNIFFNNTLIYNKYIKNINKKQIILYKNPNFCENQTIYIYIINNTYMRQYKDLGKEIFSAFTNSYEDDEPIYFDTDNISEYERIDEQITSTTYCNGADVEIKVRRIPVNKYNTSMLEVDKYNSLMNYSKNKGKIYFVIYPYDNLIYCFDLSNTKKEDMEKLIEKGHNRAMSADFASSYKKKAKATDTYGLPFSMGIAHKFDCSKWIDRIDELSKKQSRIKK